MFFLFEKNGNKVFLKTFVFLIMCKYFFNFFSLPIYQEFVNCLITT
ncbi:hypothetical protein SAMN05421788_101951 [Filimonas lacunae]|uniref:Uncharacterized protein n=1 Tax=Filimonas lacunae TaxID=477680 RepID=A0A173MQA2_9BACT|nr:hypothetical protein FLA_5567 [Filimonas lacunae]SIS74540.1 hypothetical protein SAMN05421788_101951 [Filimonas lacunae]